MTESTSESTSESGSVSSQPDLSYEQAREELTRVVQQLESGGTPLAESLALWERGERLAAMCQEFLDGAQAKIDAARTAATDSG